MRHIPELDAKGLRWLAAVAAEWIIKNRKYLPGDFDLVDDMVDFYLEQPEFYVRYTPPATHSHGRGGAPPGHWIVLLGRVSENVHLARRFARKARESRARAAEVHTYRTLDQWLAAEARGEVTRANVQEPRGATLTRKRNRRRVT